VRRRRRRRRKNRIGPWVDYWGFMYLMVIIVLGWDGSRRVHDTREARGVRMI